MKYYQIPYSYDRVDAVRLAEDVAGLPAKPVVIYGAGFHGKLLCEYFTKRGFFVRCFCDKDQSKREYCGLAVIPPDALGSEYADCLIVAAVFGHGDSIRAFLVSGGIREENIYLPPFKTYSHAVQVPVESVSGALAVKYADPRIDSGLKPIPAQTCADKILVRTSVYNVAPYYLRRAIESVLNQTYSNFMYLIVDNGSTDGSAEIIREYAKLDNRITVLSFGKNRLELNAAERREREQLVRSQAADPYPFFCTLDSDDYYESTFLEKTHRLATAHDADIVLAGTTCYREDDPDSLFQFPSPLGENVYTGKAEILPVTFEYGIQKAVPWARLYKTSRYHQYSTAYAPDIVFGITDVYRTFNFYASCDKIVILDEILHYWTRRSGSVSFQLSKEAAYVERWIYLYHHFLSVMKEWNLARPEQTEKCGQLLRSMGFGEDIDILNRAKLLHPETVQSVVGQLLKNESVIKVADDVGASDAILRLKQIRNDIEHQNKADGI